VGIIGTRRTEEKLNLHRVDAPKKQYHKEVIEMKNFIKVLALGLIAAFIFTSCAKQPTQEIEASKAAIECVGQAKGPV